ncbi:hypothetical protein FAUST_11959 [Fusarium austroamericanum]|uniref:AAA+ ATPase domain-containing protein n=1 Tax=Fusarium austroamericanum TaxID=282268 RepID=A0AAN5YXL8_FUSAU|nr:hypothetical protein FAUST_11959 [Fusarium austroamericanum]
MKSLLSLPGVFPWIRRPAVPPRIPEWFLTNNVKTAEELDSTGSDIKFGADDSHFQADKQKTTELDPLPESTSLCGDEDCDLSSSPTPPEPRETVDKENIKRNECEYPIHQDIFSELVDIANQALYHDTQPKERCSQSPALLLRTPVPGCMHYMRSVVETLAQKLHADLVSFNYEDIADISVDFSLQDSTSNHEATTLEQLPSYYFDIDSSDDEEKVDPVRARNSASTVMDSVTRKKRTTPAPERREKKKPIPRATLIHISDACMFLRGPKTTKILESFRKQIQDWRQKNNRILLVVTEYERKSPGYSERWEMMTLIEQIHVDESSIIDLIPASEEVTLAQKRTSHILETNIRSLNRALRKRLPEYREHANLSPSFSWHLDDADYIPRKLQESVLPQLVLDRAAQQIAGKSVHELASKKDMCDVMERLLKNRKMAQKWKKKRNRRRGNSSDGKFSDQSECSDSSSSSETDTDEGSSERNQREESETFEKIKREFSRKHRWDDEQIKVTLDDVILDPDVKTSMKELLRLSKFQSKHVSQKLLQKMQIKGALLYGPPGTGKTHLARALAKDMGMNFMAVTSATIEAKYVGETEKLIKAMFALCSELSPCILFIDEADALFSKRKSDDRSWIRSRINQFLQEMDGLSTNQDGPFVLVATNKPTELDEAFLRRLPHRIEFKLPTETERRKILTVLLHETNLDPEIDESMLAKATDGFSGSDLQSLCVQAVLFFSIEEKDKPHTADPTDGTGLKACHFLKGLKSTFRTVSEQSKIEIDEFTQAFGTLNLDGFEERKVYPSIYQRL